MRRVLLLCVAVVGALGLSIGTASASPICVGAGVDPVHATVCTP